MGAPISMPRRPLRLLMTTDSVGGVWTYSLEQIRALAELDLEVCLAVLGPAPTPGQLAQAKQLPNCRIFQSEYRGLEWMDDPWGDVNAAGEWLMKLAGEVCPDIVHLNEYSHASLEWPCPTVVVAHSCVSTWWRSVKGEAVPERYAEYHRRVREALRVSDVVVSPTAAFRRQLKTEHGVNRRIEVIPNCRSAALFAPGEKTNRVISAGRLWDEGKNLRLLDRIAPHVGVEIAIAGEEELQSAGSFASQGLRRLGRLEGPQLAGALSASEIYAAPALYEPFGLAILEAALSGCALVLSDLPSLRENWDDCARFVPPNDDAAWTAALNELARNSSERRWLQSRARGRALAFTPTRQARSYDALYRALSGVLAPVAAANTFA